MPRIDAHQHFWHFDKVRDAWITDEMQTIQRDFLPSDIYASLKEHNMDGCVAVQADQSEKETTFLLQLAKDNEWIKAVVGWVDLRKADINERLAYYAGINKLKGFRHILQGENVEEWFKDKAFLNGIAQLEQYKFTFDIVLNHKQLSYVDHFVKQFPNQLFVLDHLGKPDIKHRNRRQWKEDICKIAGQKQVFCKISGMATEADWSHWKEDDFHFYLDVVTTAFGTDRIMFGSDWPVCLLASSYSQWITATEKYFAAFSASEKEKIFGGNAALFYNIQ